MKHFVLLMSVCLVLGCAMSANADLIPVVNTDNSTTLGYLSVVHGGTVSGREEISLYWDSFSGVEKELNIGGTWTVDGGTANTFYLAGGTSSTTGWSTKTDNNDYVGQTAPQSYINFAGLSGSFTRGPQVYPATNNGFNWFQGDAWMAPGGHDAYWLTPDDPDLYDDFDQTLLAKLFITPGTTLSFTGRSGFAKVGGGTTTPHIFFTTNTIPEPSTLGLLFSGLVGLLCYAWRKRK